MSYKPCFRSMSFTKDRNCTNSTLDFQDLGHLEFTVSFPLSTKSFYVVVCVSGPHLFSP